MSVLLIVLAFTFTVFPAEGASSIDSLLAVWKNQKYPAAQEAVGQLIVQMYISDYERGLALSERYLREASQDRNKYFYINVLIHSYRFHQFEKKQEMLNQAVQLSKEEDFPELVAAAYTFKSISFRDNSMPDSAMIYALMAKDILTDIDNGSSLDEINQLIADMHFYAGEYMEAEKLYSNLLQMEKNFGKHWRFKTLRNNLGLIRLKQYRYDEAEEYFTAALEKLLMPPMTLSDSSGLDYQYRKLMEVNLAKGDYKKAEEFCNKGKSIAYRYSNVSELPGLYLGYSELLRKRNKLDSAHIVLTLAEAIEKEYPDPSLRASLSRERSYVYQAQGNYQKALPFLEQWVTLSKTADSVFNRAKILHIYAEHNYQITQSRAEGFKRETKLITAILMLCALSLFVIMTFYFRLRRSFKLLVEKNLELAYSSNTLPPQPITKSDSEKDEPAEERSDESPGENQIQKREIDEQILNEIAVNLERQMQEEKIYLKPDLTTAAAAQKLGTNRTYLTQAVRARYGMSFHDLINGHRIREAARIMDSAEAAMMTIDSIAEKSGFNNRVTFSKAFQQHTGISPSFFMKDIQSRKKDA